ncbi:hypothetical protein GYMLUDRAFT_963014 [Collybiopsis luxurians FD-317 M1]|uniref:Uncharacterized protein n=1 Tax=Collybiopsis luxurians FD-317 M1 TaxID=944289 RepID=A0A0D0BDT7_9AGAR|nr:hypothetical protein GYMLUDRAFT_963014 [Collybiopsis luxurians FD-317 M1]
MLFQRIPDTSKIVMNLGLIYMNQENFTLAIEKFTKAIALDHYFAIAYFQRGVCQYELKQLENALQDFHDAELMMRGNDVVYYRELGLPFELHADQVHLNHGLTLIQLGRHSEGVAYLSKSGAQENDDHELFTMLTISPPTQQTTIPAEI